MQQYRVEFFNRSLTYVHQDYSVDLSIDDDYIAIQTTVIEIGPTDKVKNGHFVRVLRDNEDYFFGVVVDVSPGEYTTKVSFRPFVALFDEDILFDTSYQASELLSKSLENTLKKYITETYISNSDTLQNLPITINVPSEESSHTKKWGMNLKSDTEGAQRCIIGLYKVLIVNALKKYGVAIRVQPNFVTKRIVLSISKITGTVHLDADLDNVTIKTLKVDDRPSGVNKLTVYNDTNYNEHADFYVYADGSWGVDGNASDRITPVVRDLKAVSPSTEEGVSASDAFLLSAISMAYDTLSGLEWENLIELQVAPNDRVVNPTAMNVGQRVTVHYQGASYTSILTGKNITLELITLVFGSERIQYTKKNKSK